MSRKCNRSNHPRPPRPKPDPRRLEETEGSAPDAPLPLSPASWITSRFPPAQDSLISDESFGGGNCRAWCKFPRSGYAAQGALGATRRDGPSHRLQETSCAGHRRCLTLGARELAEGLLLWERTEAPWLGGARRRIRGKDASRELPSTGIPDSVSQIPLRGRENSLDSCKSRQKAVRYDSTGWLAREYGHHHRAEGTLPFGERFLPVSQFRNSGRSRGAATMDEKSKTFTSRAKHAKDNLAPLKPRLPSRNHHHYQGSTPTPGR